MASLKNDFLCTLRVIESKTVLDSRFFTVYFGFQSLSVELDSGFESLVGFRISKPTIPDSTIKISWIPDSKFPQAKIFGNLDSHIWGDNGLKGRYAPTTVTPVKTSLKIDLASTSELREIHYYAYCRLRPRENLKVGHFAS